MGRRWALFERAPAPDVSAPERDWMVRWRLVQTPWFGIYVHRINGPDDTRPPHTHPWPFVSLVIRGGYHENIEHRDRTGRLRRRQVDRIRHPGSVHLMRATVAHRITVLRRSPTWTLVLVGRRRAEPSWGYWEHDQLTPWEDHASAVRFTAARCGTTTTLSWSRAPARRIPSCG